tara:strand:- start:681 stop:1133 length:453 start_codon:yes stop_codon:yes gene_type:complete
MKHILEVFVKNNLQDNNDYSEFTNELKSMKNSSGEKYLDDDDKVIYRVPKRGLMTNLLIFTTKKLIVGNRGNWDNDLHFYYENFITHKIIQNKLFFMKLDLLVKPSYDCEFYVNKKYAKSYKELHCNILTMYNPDLFNANTDWDRVISGN